MTRILFGFIFSTTLFAQNSFWVEERTFVKDENATPRVSGLMNHNFSKKWGSFAWFQVEKAYGQTYGGVTYSPKPWMQFALGPGIEQAKNPWRAGSYIWVGNRRGSVLFIAEHGGSGFWYKTEALQTFGKIVSGGLLSERFKGTGPELRIKIPKTPVAVWAAPTIEKERLNALLGIRWTF